MSWGTIRTYSYWIRNDKKQIRPLFSFMHVLRVFASQVFVSLLSGRTCRCFLAAMFLREVALGCFDEGKRSAQNGKRLTWWIFLHCSCQKGNHFSEKHSISWRCHQSDTTGIYSKERSIKELKEEAESLGSVEWSFLGHTMISWSWGFWYL